MTEAALAFVVGTGRCGSTLLGDVLAAHPDAVTVNEYLVAVAPDPLPEQPTTGVELTRMLDRPQPELSLLLRHGLEPDELRYPIDRLDGRFSRDAGLPGLLAVAIPAITASTEEPDDVWDELRGVSVTWPSSDGTGHFRRLAGWFAARTGATTVVERSGGSLRFVSALVRAFPTARFVHIHRAGPATAQSMARHPFFQLNALRRRVLRSTGHDLFDGSLGPTARDELDALAPGLTPWAFDAASFRSRPPVSAAEFGVLWSSLLHRGARVLRSLGERQVLHVDHARLCAAPGAELASIAEFLGLDPRDDWLARAVDRVRPPRPERAGGDDRLRRACAPGEAVRRTLVSAATDTRARLLTGSDG